MKKRIATIFLFAIVLIAGTTAPVYAQRIPRLPLSTDNFPDKTIALNCTDSPDHIGRIKNATLTISEGNRVTFGFERYDGDSISIRLSNGRIIDPSSDSRTIRYVRYHRRVWRGTYTALVTVFSSGTIFLILDDSGDCYAFNF